MRRAFTLTELLVVVALLALMAAILFPVFARVREAGRRVVCVSNLKQLSTAFLLYTEDWGRYPGGGRARRPYRGDWVFVPFHYQIHVERGSLWAYTRSRGVYRCPSDLTQYRLSYSMSELMEFRGLADMRSPASTPLLVDQEWPIAGRGGPDDGVFSVLFMPDRLTARHNGRGNLLYVDGHVQSYRRQYLDCGVACRMRIFQP